MTTLSEIKQTKSYDALRRNGLSDENILQFYSLPNGQRGAFLNSFKREKVENNQSKSEVKSVGTQKCAEVSVRNLRGVALDLMSKDYHYRGRVFNLKDMGWRFEFNNRKSAFGLCWSRYKKIYLSKYLIDNSNADIDFWVDTILHEIAHAIDFAVRGTSNHDYRWKRIAVVVGAKPERCGNAKVDPKSSKYTLVCDNCGNKQPSHKIKKIASACGKCCKKYNGGRYSDKFKLRQVQNY